MFTVFLFLFVFLAILVLILGFIVVKLLREDNRRVKDIMNRATARRTLEQEGLPVPPDLKVEA